MKISSDKNLYINFINNNANDMPLFFFTEWLDCLCGPDNWQVGLVLEESTPIAVMPYFIKQKYFFKAATMPSLTPFLGMWIQKNSQEKYNECLELLLRNFSKYSLINFSNHFSYISSNPILTHFDYKVIERNTYIISNMPYEEVKNNYIKSLRSDLRFATQKLIVENQNNVADLYAMMQITFKSQGQKMPIDISLLEKIFNNEKFNARIYTARELNNTVASIMTVEDNTTAYYLLSGRSKESPRGAVALLLDAAIKETMEQGKDFDFEGSSIPSIAAFFKSFGPIHKTYSNANKINNSALAAIINFRGKKND